MDKYKLISNHLSDGVMEIDARGIIVFCNQRAALLDDILPQNVIGKPLLSVYPTLNKDSSTVYKVLASGQPILNFSQTFSNYKGKVITTINSTLPVFEGGQVVGAIEVSRDITEVKMMSEQIVELQSQINSKKRKGNRALGDVAHYQLKDIITRDATMLRLKGKALKAAATEESLLVCGETGTGKELFVQAIHAAGGRAKAPFIAQNCAALPASLLEGILFGSVEGAFTGATNRSGLLEAADGGTIFLDEINAMPVELQAKLLRFLQDGYLRRIGATHSVKVDVRVIAALNQTPESALESGHLRRDLYYRLNTIVFELPPLRNRRGDIVLLTEHFINKCNQKMKRRVKGVVPEVAELFEIYNWPGNVRELEHVISGAISMLDGHWITLAELPAKLLRAARGQNAPYAQALTLEEAVAKLERDMIGKALLTAGKNVTLAAKQLGIPRQTLQYKIKKLSL